MNQEQLVKYALELLRGNDTYIADAREGVRVGNSVVGSLLSIQFQTPRQYAEQAVAAALDVLDSIAASPDEGGNYMLRRSGQAPLRFQGTLLAEADGKHHYGREQDRWHELAVYRTSGGKYVVAIGYSTRWKGEGDRNEVVLCDVPHEVGQILRAYDPTAYVRGFPLGDAYAAKQARLLADIRGRYDALVSELLSGDEFVERVD